MNKASRRRFESSCDWIRKNWNATNADVSDELLAQWIYPVDEDEEQPSGFHLAVFAFGFLQHDLVSHNVPHGVERSFLASELLEHFHGWQMKLALTEIERKTHVHTNPLPLFSFPADERVQVNVCVYPVL